MPILGIDHGEKRIGIAISDPTDTIATPLVILRHVSRIVDARLVLEIAGEHQVTAVVIGESTDEDGAPNLAGRRAGRFAATLRSLCDLAIVLWDESLSTQDAREWRLASGASRKRRAALVDAAAAAVMLQSYLETLRQPGTERTAND